MSEEEPKKKYNTNPLDKRVAERAEAEMGEPVDTEAPTRAMPLGDVPPPIAGGPTSPVGNPTGPNPGAETANVPRRSSGDIVPPAPPTQGMYTPPDYHQPQQQPYGHPDYRQPAPPAYGPANPYQQPPQPYGHPDFHQQQPHMQVPPMPPQPYGQPFMNQPPHQQPSQRFQQAGSEALGLKPNFAAMLGYLPFVGIAAAFLLVVMEPARNRFVRFHAKQALIAQIAFWVILLSFNLAHQHVPGIVSFLLYFPHIAFILGSLVGLIMMMSKAYAGERAKIPIIGDQAE